MQIELVGQLSVEPNVNDCEAQRARMVLPIAQIKQLDSPAKGGRIPWPNPRERQASTKVAKTIRKAALADPANFHLYNQGITITADDLTIVREGKRGLVRLGFRRDSAAGLINGGTTQGALSHLVTGNPEAAGYVSLELIGGLHTSSQPAACQYRTVALARNHGKEMDNFSVANYDEHFGWLKEIFDGATHRGLLAPRLAYRDGDSAAGSYRIVRIIQLLTLFACQKEVNDAVLWNPTKAYSSTKASLAYYIENKGDYERYSSVLLDIVHLYEHIQHQLPVLVGPSFYEAAIIDQNEARQKITLPCTGAQINYRPHNAWTFPILAAFSANLDVTRRTAKWITEPIELADKLVVGLFNMANDLFVKQDTGFNSLGFTQSLYDSMRQEVTRRIK